MRRSLVLLSSGVIVFGMAASPAAADPAAITIRSASLAQAKGWTSPIMVSVLAAAPVTGISVTVRADDGSAPATVVGDFQLVSGTSTDGVWQSATAPSLPLAVLDLDVSVTDAAGDHTTVQNAARIAGHVAETFQSFAVTPGTVGLDRTPPTFAGRLVYTDVAGQVQPVAGASVHVYDEEDNSVMLTTDADGAFAGQFATPTAPEWYRAGVAAGGGLSPALTWANVDLARFATRIVGTAVSPGEPHVNDAATVSGTLEYQDAAGTWQPLAGQQVRVVPDLTPLHGNPVWATTGADGTFRLTGLDTPTTGLWSVSFDPSSTPNGTTSAFSPYGVSSATASVANPAELMKQPKLSAPETTLPYDRVAVGATVNLYGRLSLPVGSLIRAQFSTDGEKWTTTSFSGTVAAPFTTPVHGEFPNVKVPVKVTADGLWRLTFAGSRSTVPGFLPAVGKPIFLYAGSSYWFTLTNRTQGRAAPGTRLKFTVDGTADTPSGPKVPAKGSKFKLEFSTDDLHWKVVKTVAFGTGGKATTWANAKETGFWRGYVAQYRKMTTEPFITVRRRSRLTTLKLTQSHRTVHLAGTLQGKIGGSWHSLANRKLNVYFRPNGAKSAVLVTAVKTSASGHFTVKAKARGKGVWYVGYAGSSIYWSVTSPTRAEKS